MKAHCPNCGIQIDSAARQCPACNVDFTTEGGWRPVTEATLNYRIPSRSGGSLGYGLLFCVPGAAALLLAAEAEVAALVLGAVAFVMAMPWNIAFLALWYALSAALPPAIGSDWAGLFYGAAIGSFIGAFVNGALLGRALRGQGRRAT